MPQKIILPLSPYKRSTSFSAPYDELRALAHYSLKSGIPMAHIIRRAVKDYMQAHPIEDKKSA